MANRMTLHRKFKVICPKVYFQAPDSEKMEFPCIRYQLNDVKSTMADDLIYVGRREYRVQILSRDVDTEILGQVLALPFTKFKNFMTVNDINQWTIHIIH